MPILPNFVDMFSELSYFQTKQQKFSCLRRNCTSLALTNGTFEGLTNNAISTNKSAISLLFSYYLTLVLSSPPCSLFHLSFYLKLCGRSGKNCLFSPVLLGYNGSPDTHFYRETTRLMSGPDGQRYLRPPLSLVVCLLLSLVSTLVLSRTGGVLAHQNSLTHRFPRFPPRNLCSLVMLAVSSLVFAATNTAFF